MLRRAFAALLLVLLAAAPAFADVAVPALAARVTDQTGTLTAEQKAALEQKLAAFEQRKGSQIAILIVPTTEPETIEQYSIRVAEQWKLGRKGVDDGLLILVARNDRTLRIEVGYGLEGVVPDAIAHRVIDEIIVPRFRDGDYYGGLDAGVDQLIKVVDGEPLPPPPERQRRSGGKLESLIPILFFALVAAQFLRRVFGAGFGSLLAGGAVFGLAWLFSGMLLLAAFFGLVAFVLTLFGAVIPLGGGWNSRGGGGFGGGGFGGGGFGGGGGGFGGGGASGRW
ncbi:TPM domain-containing protein [Solimonas soli]|uniref:TPM domain-containing protein n=1 Tax=Solimonas soli TaxID=413479 RepID=UPI000489AAA3|nr:YgcG family protein [Solimonas soli]